VQATGRVKAAITCVRKNDGWPSVKIAQQRYLWFFESPGSITLTRFLCVRFVSLSERLLTEDGQVTHKFLLEFICNLK